MLAQILHSNMKLGAVLFLVSLITLSLEVQELQAAVRPLQLLGKSEQMAALFFLE